MFPKIIIAIDGHASCGKSTLAKAVAKHFNYIYLDSGAMYRAVTLFCLQNGVDVNDGEAVSNTLPYINITFRINEETGTNDTYLNGKNVEKLIRSKAVSQQVSPVSTVKAVRAFLVKQQQQIGKNKGIAIDGRDIGTVVFPDAELKVFLTAKVKVRAQRRFDEAKAKGFDMDYNEIIENLKKRDYIDSNRKVSPLKKADDAVVIDNSYIDQQEQLKVVVELAEKAMNMVPVEK